MGLFNTLVVTETCPECARLSEMEVQFKYAEVRQLIYRLGEKLQWPFGANPKVSDLNRMISGIAFCQYCKGDYVYFNIVLREGKIVECNHMNKSPCSSIQEQSSFLCCLLHLYFIKNSLDKAIRLVSSIYEQPFEFTVEFENFLLKFWETSDPRLLTKIAKELVHQHLHLLDTENYIFVIAILVENNEVSIDDAALLLKYDYCSSSDERVKRIIDVAWLITEDTEDGIMSNLLALGSDQAI